MGSYGSKGWALSYVVCKLIEWACVMEPYMTTRNVTCILAALNNYSGYDVFTVNPLPRPTKFCDFVREFGALTDGSLALVGIPGRVFHVLYLAGVILPRHIFAVKGSHIYNYVYNEFFWWRVDSREELREKIHVGEIGMGDDMVYLPYAKSDLETLQSKLRSWTPDRGKDYYANICTTILNAIQVE